MRLRSFKCYVLGYVKLEQKFMTYGPMERHDPG